MTSYTELSPIQFPPRAKRIDKKGSHEDQQRLWPNEHAKAENKPTEKPSPDGGQKIRLRSNEIEIVG